MELAPGLIAGDAIPDRRSSGDFSAPRDLHIRLNFVINDRPFFRSSRLVSFTPR
jgi:hypothetical protein